MSSITRRVWWFNQRRRIWRLRNTWSSFFFSSRSWESRWLFLRNTFFVLFLSFSFSFFFFLSLFTFLWSFTTWRCFVLATVFFNSFLIMTVLFIWRITFFYDFTIKLSTFFLLFLLLRQLRFVSCLLWRLCSRYKRFSFLQKRSLLHLLDRVY